MNKEITVPVEPARKSRVSSLNRIGQILDFLTKSNEPLSPHAIAKGTRAPVSTIYVTIEEMVNARFLSRNPDGTVWVGDRLYFYGLAYSSKYGFNMPCLDGDANPIHEGIPVLLQVFVKTQ